jgi:hypothetical protein
VSVEQEVLAAAEALVADYGAGGVDAYFERLDPEAVFIFYTAPHRLESREAYRTTWDRWVAEDGFRVLECKASNQVVQGLGPDAAVLSHDVVTTPPPTTARRPCTNARASSSLAEIAAGKCSTSTCHQRDLLARPLASDRRQRQEVIDDVGGEEGSDLSRAVVRG